jgi:uncharacterized protein
LMVSVGISSSAEKFKWYHNGTYGPRLSRSSSLTSNGRAQLQSDQIRVAMRQAILQTASELGARDVRVFGSVARGEERPDSDIDFLVTLEPGRTLMDLARLETRLEALLGRPVDVATVAGLREPVRSSALREAFHV